MGWDIEHVELGPMGRGDIGAYAGTPGVLLSPWWKYTSADPVLAVDRASMRIWPHRAGFATMGWAGETEHGTWTWADAGPPVPLSIGFRSVAKLGKTDRGACWLVYEGGQATIHRAECDLSNAVPAPVKGDKAEWTSLEHECLLKTEGEEATRYTRIRARDADQMTFELPKGARVRFGAGGSEPYYVWVAQDTLGVARSLDGKVLWTVPIDDDGAIHACGDLVVVGRPDLEGRSRIDVIDAATGSLADSWAAGFPQRTVFRPDMWLATDGNHVVWHISPTQIRADLIEPPVLQWRRIGGAGGGTLPCPADWRVQRVHCVRPGFFVIAGGVMPHYPNGPQWGREGYLMVRQVEEAGDVLHAPERPRHSVTKVPRSGGKHGFQITIHEPMLHRLVRYSGVLIGEVASESGYLASKKKSLIDKKFDGSIELVVDREGLDGGAEAWLDRVVGSFNPPQVWETILAGDSKTPIHVSWRWM